MPNLDRLHELSRKLAELTAPGKQEIGLISWCVFTGETWKEIAEMWSNDPKRAAAPDLYAALEELLKAGQHEGICDNYDPESGVQDGPCDLHIAAHEARCVQARAALLKANPERKEPA